MRRERKLWMGGGRQVWIDAKARCDRGKKNIAEAGTSLSSLLSLFYFFLLTTLSSFFRFSLSLYWI